MHGGNVYDKKLSIYTDLDTMFDTRSVIAVGLDPNNVIPEIETFKYVNRIRDQFGNIPYNVFRSYYNRRDILTLEDAPLTSICKFIREHYADISTEVNLSGKQEEITLYVNLYPYILGEDRLKDLTKIIDSLIQGITIQYIFKTYDELTPAWVKDNVGSMFMYDGPYWLEYVNQNLGLVHDPLLNVMLISPSLVNMNTLKIKIDDNYFKDFQKLISYMIEYHPIAAKYFSGMIFYPPVNDVEKAE